MHAAGGIGMRPGGTVVVGYDGSPSGTRALRWAAGEADRWRADVLVVACYSLPAMAEPWYVPPMASVVALEDEACRQIDAAVSALQPAHPATTFTSRAVLGSAVDRLVEAAQDAELLVVGRHGHGERSRWRLGSVAHGVARRAPCPVAVVPEAGDRPSQQRVVVGVDGSTTALAALEWATAEADRRSATLVVAHVWSYPYASEVGTPAGRDMTEIDAALELGMAIERARERHGGPIERVLVEGHPVDELVALTEGADLLVVGNRGRGALRSSIFGSTSQDVAAHAHCPVVVVRTTP